MELEARRLQPPRQLAPTERRKNLRTSRWSEDDVRDDALTSYGVRLARHGGFNHEAGREQRLHDLIRTDAMTKRLDDAVAATDEIEKTVRVLTNEVARVDHPSCAGARIGSKGVPRRFRIVPVSQAHCGTGDDQLPGFAWTA